MTAWFFLFQIKNLESLKNDRTTKRVGKKKYIYPLHAILKQIDWEPIKCYLCGTTETSDFIRQYCYSWVSTCINWTALVC
jgi:hypothetical protein